MTVHVHDLSHVLRSGRSLMAQNLSQYFCNAEDFNPVEAVVFGATVQAATSTGCIDKRNAHDVSVVGPIVQKMIQDEDFSYGERSINPNEVPALGRHSVHGAGGSSHSHEERAPTPNAS